VITCNQGARSLHAAPLQVHSGNLQAVLDIVISHQGISTKCELAQRLLTALVVPDPASYRPQLRRLAALRTKGAEQLVLRAHNLLVGVDTAVISIHLACLEFFLELEFCFGAAANTCTSSQHESQISPSYTTVSLFSSGAKSPI
jgi:hypothetical protein